MVDSHKQHNSWSSRPWDIWKGQDPAWPWCQGLQAELPWQVMYLANAQHQEVGPVCDLSLLAGHPRQDHPQRPPTSAVPIIHSHDIS